MNTTTYAFYKRISFFISIISFLFIINNTYATHIAGMDLTYKHISGTTYEINAVYYRDCAGIAAPTSVSVTVKSATAGVNKTVTLYPLSGTGKVISTTCGAVKTICEGGTEPGIQKWEYRATTTLGSQRADWEFTTGLCCRNNAITTIVKSGSTQPAGTSVVAKLNNLTAPGNSSPYFTNNPFAFICINQNMTFNHGVIDKDGDSLAYSFVMPVTDVGNTDPVIYLSPFTLSNPLTSSTPITLDPITGNINMTPSALQITVMAVEIKEYRSGKLIGSVIRDMELWVVNCGVNSLPTATGVNGTNSYSINACAGTKICFNIFSNDIDNGQKLTMSWNNAIPNATFTQTPGSHPTGHFCWTPTLADIGSNVFTVSVQDDACPSNAFQIFSYNINVTGVDVLPGNNIALSCLQTSGTISASSSVAGVTYQWQGPGIVSGNTTSSPTVNQAGTYTVIVTNPTTNCTNSSTVNVTLNNALPNISASGSFSLTCVSTSGVLNANSSTSGVSYLWTGLGIVSGNTTTSVTVNLPGTYTITVTNPANGCTNTATVAVNSNTTPPDLSVAGTAILNCKNNNTALIASSLTPAVNYLWSGPGIVSGSTTTTPLVNVAGTYTVIVTNPINGCTSSFTVNVTNGVPPSATVSADITINEGDSVQLFASGGTNYNWFPSTGLSCANCTSPMATPFQSTMYCVAVSDNNDCSDTACVRIEVLDLCPDIDSLVLPNVFSPNGDGENDMFLIAGINDVCIEDFSIAIYSRWGQLIYQSYNNSTWDGRTASGLISQEGTYYYIINLKPLRKDSKAIKGSLTLVR